MGSVKRTGPVTTVPASFTGWLKLEVRVGEDVIKNARKSKIRGWRVAPITEQAHRGRSRTPSRAGPCVERGAAGRPEHGMSCWGRPQPMLIGWRESLAGVYSGHVAAAPDAGASSRTACIPKTWRGSPRGGGWSPEHSDDVWEVGRFRGCSSSSGRCGSAKRVRVCTRSS